METYVIEATQPGYMDTPEDGAVRVTVEGCLDDARPVFMAVLNHTADVLGVTDGSTERPAIEAESVEPDTEVTLQSWKHTIRLATASAAR